MTITAKFAGRCTVCGGRITPGQSIEWTKSGGSRHASCTAPAETSRRQAPTGRPYGRRQAGQTYSSRPAVSRRLREPGEGERIIHRASKAYTVGETVTIRGIEGYWTVVAQGSHRIDQYEDDTREGERVYDAIVRPASETEAAARAAEVAAADARTARRTEVERALRTSRVIGETDARLQRLPEGSVQVWGDARLAGSETWYEAPDGSIWYVRSDYDMGAATWRTTATRAQLEEAQALGLKAGLL